MKRWWNSFVNNQFLRNFSTQAGGTMVALFISSVFSLWITRNYLPEELRDYNVFFALVTIAGMGVGFRYPMSIPTIKNDKEAAAMYWFSLLNNILYTLICTGIIALYLIYWKEGDFDYSLWWYGVYLFLFGVYQITVYSAIREKKFTQNASFKIYQALGLAFFTILFTYIISVQSWIPIASRTIGVGITSIIAFTLLRPKWYLPKRLIYKSFKKYISYPKHSLLPSFLNTLAIQIIVLVFDSRYTANEAGQYGFTYFLIAAPLSVFGNSFRDVFLQRLSEMKNNRKGYQSMLDFHWKSSKFLLLFGLVFGIGTAIVGLFCFEWLFTKEYMLSGKYAAIISISLFVKMIVPPLSPVFNVLDKLKWASYWQYSFFAVLAISFYIGIVHLKWNAIQFLWASVIIDVIAFATLWFLQRAVFKNKMKNEKIR